MTGLHHHPTRRFTDRRGWWKEGGWKIVLAAFLSSLFFSAVMIGYFTAQRKLDRKDCARIGKLTDALDGILNRQLKALPANAFFRSHPDALLDAQKQIRQDLHDLNSARCQVR